MREEFHCLFARLQDTICNEFGLYYFEGSYVMLCHIIYILTDNFGQYLQIAKRLSLQQYASGAPHNPYINGIYPLFLRYFFVPGASLYRRNSEFIASLYRTTTEQVPKRDFLSYAGKEEDSSIAKCLETQINHESCGFREPVA